MDLIDLGWQPFFQESFQSLKRPDWLPGRILVEQKRHYRVWTESGEIVSEISGKMRYNATEPAHFPTVGDWVALAIRPDGVKGVIHQMLPRKSKISRKAAGDRTAEQLLAANVDYLFLVQSLNNDFNLRRLERYLTMVWESGARPVVLLSKTDLCPDWPEISKGVAEIAKGADVFAVSALEGQGIEEVRQFVRKGVTVAFLGSSGVGKSTLVNQLAGTEAMEVGEIRADDDAGRHTTTHRELIVLPEGGLLIDTPGLREFQLWETAAGLEGTFTELEEIALRCRFSNCKHETEPGCAVRAAIASGELDAERLSSYRKLQEELRTLEKRRAKASNAPPKRSR